MKQACALMPLRMLPSLLPRRRPRAFGAERLYVVFGASINSLQTRFRHSQGTDTMKLLYKISTFLILALRILHVSMTTVFFQRFAQNAMWFASGGLMMVLISFMNFVLMRDVGKERVVQVLCHVTNIIGLMFASTMFVLGRSRAVPPLQSFFCSFCSSLKPQQHLGSACGRRLDSGVMPRDSFWILSPRMTLVG